MNSIQRMKAFFDQIEGGDIEQKDVEQLMDTLNKDEQDLMESVFKALKGAIEWAATKVIAISGKLATMDDPMKDNTLFKAVDMLGSMGVPVPLIALYFKAIKVDQDPKRLMAAFLEGVLKDPIGFAKSMKDDITSETKEPSSEEVDGLLNDLQNEIDKFHKN